MGQVYSHASSQLSGIGSRLCVVPIPFHSFLALDIARTISAGFFKYRLVTQPEVLSELEAQPEELI